MPEVNLLMGIILVIVFLIVMVVFILLARKHSKNLSTRKIKEITELKNIKTY